MRSIVIASLLVSLSASAHAFNALGHKVIGEIAWEELTPERRAEIVGVLLRLATLLSEK